MIKTNKNLDKKRKCKKCKVIKNESEMIGYTRNLNINARVFWNCKKCWRT